MTMNIIEKYNRIANTNESSVGLVEHDFDLENHWEPVCVKPEYLETFAQKAQEMGIEYLAMYVRDEYPIFAHEHDDDFGYHLCLTPALPDGEDDDD